jgi:hypothetical protein
MAESVTDDGEKKRRNRIKHDPYMCPRCEYKTAHKPTMRKHLYNLKKPCPGIIEDITLTEEIKESILRNRIYHPPKPVVEPKQVTNNHQTINQVINNYNTMNNFIAQMDPIDKLTRYMKYNNAELLTLDFNIQEKYCDKRESIEFAKSYNSCIALKQDDLLEIIDEVSKLVNGHLEELNVIYDNKTNKLKLYGLEGLQDWEEVLVAKGINKIIELTKTYYLDTYECYLIRRLQDPDESNFNKQKCREQLIVYYKFIGCFDIDPYVKDRLDYEILYDLDDDRYDVDNCNRYVEEEFYPMYTNIRDKTSKRDINNTKRDVIEIVKRNTKRNVDELNKKVAELFQMDETFKTNILRLR